MRKTLLVMSGKGGVGKTTLAVNLALNLARKGNKVGILDADIHGPNVLKMLGYSGPWLKVVGDKIAPIWIGPMLFAASIAGFVEDNSAIIWRGPMKHTAIKQLALDVRWGALDYLVVDLPPGTGDEHLSVVQLMKDIVGAVIISTPQQVSIMDMMRAVDFCRQTGVKIIGVIENMSGGIFGSGTVEKVCKANDLTFLGQIPLSKEVVQSGEEGKPLFEYNNPGLNTSFNNIMKKIIGVK